jgi:hypothetical protein
MYARMNTLPKCSYACACMHTCLYMCICNTDMEPVADSQAYVHACRDEYIFRSVHMYEHVYVYVQVLTISAVDLRKYFLWITTMHTCIHTYIHTYTHACAGPYYPRSEFKNIFTYIHTHIHTHTHTCAGPYYPRSEPKNIFTYREGIIFITHRLKHIHTHTHTRMCRSLLSPQ